MTQDAGKKSILSSVQFKFALVFLTLIAGLLVMLNTYPTIVTRDLVFASKQSSLQSQAGVISSTLSTTEKLTPDSVSKAMEFMDVRNLSRVIITNENALIIYDTAEFDPATGRYALFSEISRALSGYVICYSVYDGTAFMTHEAMPIKISGETLGAVYLYEYDRSQAELISEIQRNLRNITFVLGIVTLLLSLVFSRALTSRITELVRATKTVSSGDYDHRITVSGSDELSELAEEFNNLTLRLKETEELRRRFVSDAGHELKTPLASIRLLSDSIVTAENMDNDTMMEFVADIGTEAERLQRIAEKLLSLSKIDSAANFDFEKQELRLIIENTLRLLEPLAKENQITITTELEDGYTVYGNEDLIYRIVFNLAENGIKYNMPGGEVAISLRRRRGEVLLAVEDTGIGIPTDDLPHIFSRFYRVDKARSRDAGGSGLGLSIVHDAVKLHGGEIDVERLGDRGTRFTVSFPAYDDAEEDNS